MANKFGPQGLLALWRNQFKKSENQPDFTGNVKIPVELINLAAEDSNCRTEIDGEDYIVLTINAWHNDDEGRKPIVSGRLQIVVPKQQADDKPARASTSKRKLS